MKPLASAYTAQSLVVCCHQLWWSSGMHTAQGRHHSEAGSGSLQEALYCRSGCRCLRTRSWDTQGWVLQQELHLHEERAASWRKTTWRLSLRPDETQGDGWLHLWLWAAHWVPPPSWLHCLLVPADEAWWHRHQEVVPARLKGQKTDAGSLAACLLHVQLPCQRCLWNDSTGFHYVEQTDQFK